MIREYHSMVLDNNFGWIPRPDEVSRILATKTHPLFSDAAPHLDNYWQGEDIGLWRAAKQCNNNKHLPADKQGIGDCVSHGHARGIDYLYCCKQISGLLPIDQNGNQIPYQEGITSCMSEALYGDARRIGNDLSMQDGACGIWAVESLQQDGYIYRDGKPYNSQLAKQYGYSGTPQSLLTQGKIRVLEQYSKTLTPQDCANSLKAGCPVTVCSNQGFTLQRDSNGVCAPQGQWGHCMLIIGVYTFSGKHNFVILQSWGQNTPSGPVPMGEAPDNSFGASWDIVANMLKADGGDSYSLAGIKGYQPLSVLDWVM